MTSSRSTGVPLWSCVGSRFYTKKVVQDIRKKTDILERLPRAGKKGPKLNEHTGRELTHYSHRIIYEVKEQGIFVLAVAHKRRDVQADDIDCK